MSNPVVNPGAVETQQMRVVAPVGVSILNLHPSSDLYLLTVI